jgi:protein O-mannosyl-transferase
LISLFPNKKYSDKLLLVIIVLVTFFVQFNSLNNDFQENWDDNIYITENPNLQSPKEGYIKNAFTTFSNGHYHPLTTLSYVADYKLFGLNPKPFHATNLVIHLLVSLLVFGFINLLVKEQFIAFFTALLFGIHPMHVESVAWISDRKDLLCTLFYVGALCTYLLFLKNKKTKFLFYTFLLFILSLFSKSMAITLPFVLLLLDHFKGRKLEFKTILEKIPFIVLSVIFGYVSILSQKSNEALGDMNTVDWFSKIMFGSYAVIMYLVKLFVPGSLSAFYNYPLTEKGTYPLIFYIAPFILAGLLFFLYKLKSHKKMIWFGFGFFLITIALVLQFVPAGNVIMADRYTYLPYIGLFLVLAYLVNYFYNTSKSLRPAIFALVMIYGILCSVISYSRTKVWKDSMLLWSDTIEKNPDAALPYSNRAALFIQKKDYQRAIADLNKAIEIRPKYVTPHYNRGVLFIKTGKYREAVQDFDFVMKNNPRDILSVHMERGNAYMFGRNYPKAIEDFSAALNYNPDLAPAFYNRGMSFHSIGKYPDALSDFNNLIRLNPGFSKAYYLRAMTLYKMHDYRGAMQDAMKAKQLGYKVDPGFLQELSNKLKV